MKTWRTRYVGDRLIQCSCSKGVELEAKGQLQVSGGVQPIRPTQPSRFLCLTGGHCFRRLFKTLCFSSWDSAQELLLRPWTVALCRLSLHLSSGLPITIVTGMGSSKMFLFIYLTPIISLTTTDYSAQQNTLAFAVEKCSDC